MLMKCQYFTEGQGHQLKAFKQAIVKMVTAPYLTVCGSVVGMAYSVFQTALELFGDPQHMARILHGRLSNTSNNPGCTSPGNHYDTQINQHYQVKRDFKKGYAI